MVLKAFKKENIKYIILFIFILFISIFILPVSVPIILALLTAIVIEPVVKFTQRVFKWKRKPAVITNFIFSNHHFGPLIFHCN